MPIPRYGHILTIGDLYYVKASTAVTAGQVMILTGSSTSLGDQTYYEIAPYLNGDYDNKVVGVALNAMSATYPNRYDITVVIHGVVGGVPCSDAVAQGESVMGAPGGTIQTGTSGNFQLGRVVIPASSGSNAVIEVNMGWY